MTSTTNQDLDMKVSEEFFYLNNSNYENEHEIEKSQKYISSVLTPYFEVFSQSYLSSSVTFCVTGSDGRNENIRSKELPGSDLEFVVILDKKESHEVVTNLMKQLIDSVNTESMRVNGVNFIDSDVEYRALDEEENALFYYGWGKKELFPTRAFDLKYVWGSSSIYQKYADKISSDIQKVKSLAPFQKTRIKPVRSQLSQALAGDHPNVSWNLDDGTASIHYNPEEKQLGTKTIILRPMQYYLARQLFEAFKKKQISVPVHELPKSLESRLHYLSNENLLFLPGEKGKIYPASEEDVGRYARAYQKGLYIHNNLKSEQRKTRNTASVTVNASEFRELLETVQEFSDTNKGLRVQSQVAKKAPRKVRNHSNKT